MAGGGYLRLYPHAVTDSYIRQQNRLGRPAMLYFHPWELDTEQPRIPVGMLPGFQHYVNLSGTEGKLDRLLGAQSIVVRALPESLDVDSTVAGVTLDADGNPRPLLDPDGLLAAAARGRLRAPRRAPRW